MTCLRLTQANEVDVDNPVEGDLHLSNGQLSFVSGKEYVRQVIQNRLAFFKGEWYLDQRQGFPFFIMIFVKNPNLSRIASAIRKVVLGVNGVTKCSNVVVEFSDRDNRILSTSFVASTDFGEIPFVDKPYIIELPKDTGIRGSINA